MILSATAFRELYPGLKVPGSDQMIEATIAAADGLLAIVMGLPLPDSGGHTLEETAYTLFPGPSRVHYRAVEHFFRLPWTVTTIHIDPDLAYGAATKLDAAGFVSDPREGRIWIKPSALLDGGATAAWSREPLANRIVLDAGWTAATAPEALLRALAVQTRYLFELSDLQGRENVTTRIGRFSSSEAEELLAPGVMAGLVGYAFPGSLAARAMEPPSLVPGQVTP